MANIAQPQVVINYISQLKKITVNRNNQPSQLIIQTDYNLNETYNFQVINKINQIVELDSNTTYQLYGTYIDAKKQVHILFYTLGVTPRDNVLSFLVNTYTSEYLAYVKNNRTPIDISIVAKQNVGGSTKSYMVLRDCALANPRGYIEGQAPTDIVYQNVFNSQIPVSTAFGAGNNINLVQDLEGQEIYSFAFGDTLSTNNANQFVIGYNNTPDATKAFIIANDGNIFTVDYEGNVEANTISTTTLYINGEEIGQAVDDKVDDLSTAFDEKLSATEDWVSDTFETKESATQTFNELEEDIDGISAFVSGLPTDIALKADQTDLDEANQNINTISGQVEYLSGAIDQNISDIGDLNTAVGSKANQTDLEALSTTVEGLAETKADLSSVYTKEEVYTYIETDVKINEATSGKADKSELTGLATKDEVQAVDDKFVNYYTSTQVDAAISTAIDEIDIPSTVYTGEDGIKVENGVISLTATLSSITNDAGFITSADIPTSYVERTELTAYATTGWVDQNYAKKGEAPTDVYTKAEVNEISSALSSAVSDAGYLTEIPTSYVQQSDLEDYAKTGDIPTTEQIQTQIETAITGKANSADVYTKTEVNQISTALSSAVSGAGYLTEIPTSYVQEDAISDMATQTWVGEQGYLTEVPNTYALKTDIPTDAETYEAISGNIEAQITGKNYITSDALNGLATEQYVTEQVSGKADQSTVETLSTNLSAAITGVVDSLSTKADTSALDDLATEADLQYVSGVVSTQAEDIDALKAVSGEVDYETVFDMLSSGDTDTLTITKDTTNQKIVLTAAGGGGGGDKTYHGENGIAVDNVNDTISISANFLSANALEGYATQSWVGEQGFALTSQLPTDYTTSAQVSSIVEGYDFATKAEIPTTVAELTDASDYALKSELPSDYTTSAQVSSIVEGYNYITAEGIPNTYAQKTDVEEASGAAVNAATGWVNAQDYLKSVPSEYITETELTTELTAYATSSWVDTNYAKKGDVPTDVYTKTEVNAISSALSSTVSEAGYLTEVPNTVSAAAVDAATGWVDAQNYLTEVPNTYALKTDIPTNDEITGLAKDYVDTLNIATTYATKDELSSKTTSAQVSAIVTGFNYITGITIEDAYDQTSHVSSLVLTDDFSYYNELYWNGLFVDNQAGQGNGDYRAKKLIFSNDFSVNFGDEVSEISINSDILSGYATQTWVGQQGFAFTSDIPSNSDISGIASAVASAYVEGSSISAVGQLINDVGYITGYQAGAGIAINNGVISATGGGGGGTTYTAGSGILIDNSVIKTNLVAGNNVTFSIADNVVTINATGGGGGGSQDLSDYNNDVPFITAEDINNKQRVNTVNGSTITFDQSYEIFKTTYTGGDVTLNAVTVTTSQIGNGEVATFEEWITFSNAVTSLSEGTNTLIGDWPSSFDNTKTHVLVRRLYNNNGTITQYVSYAYNF